MFGPFVEVFVGVKVSTSGMNLPGGRGRILPGKRLLARGRSRPLVGVKQLIGGRSLKLLTGNWGLAGVELLTENCIPNAWFTTQTRLGASGGRERLGLGSWLRFLLVHLWQPWKMEGVCVLAVSAELMDCCEDGYKIYWVRITDVVW